MNQERTTSAADDPFDPQTALSRIQAFRNTFMSTFPQVGNLPFMMGQQSDGGLGNVNNVLAAAAAAAAMNQSSNAVAPPPAPSSNAAGKRRKNPNPVSSLQLQQNPPGAPATGAGVGVGDYGADDWGQPKAIPLLKNIIQNSSPPGKNGGDSDHDVPSGGNRAENGDDASPRPESDRVRTLSISTIDYRSQRCPIIQIQLISRFLPSIQAFTKSERGEANV
jgi:hypothetical protein